MKKLVTLITVSILLTACASTTKVVSPVPGAKTETEPVSYADIDIVNQQTDAPRHFIDAVESYLAKELTDRSLFDIGGERKIKVTVVDYRMRSGFARAMFGVFAGKDGIDSEVTVTDGETGEVIGESTVSSFNVTAFGEMDDIARMHAEEIARFLAGEKG